ncbi:hypothetical protein RE6C_01114 [Rhodopirellula europaea 6C]|uniref:Uncharacterized protein n=1 Tax=Rhodopirellula europaea 6C TaxID=1263867 RepID=M2AZN8_9BACT|nr:hypothetical protein RE6C_01114 [Rhodopirellula europaea 6C]
MEQSSTVVGRKQDWVRNRESKLNDPVGAESPMVATAGNAL